MPEHNDSSIGNELGAALDRLLDGYRSLDVEELAKRFQHDTVEVFDIDHRGSLVTVEVFGFWDSHKENHFRVIASANGTGRWGRDVARDFIRSPVGFIDE